MYTQENAQITIQQLGGSSRLSVMIDAKNFAFDTERAYVGFKFMKGKDGINYVKIALNSMDTYDIEFGRIYGTNYTVKKTINGVYCDMLVKVFEETTGLYLSL